MKLKKISALFFASILATTFLTGCNQDNNDDDKGTPPVEDNVVDDNEMDDNEVDEIGSASVSNDPAMLVRGLSAEGGWLFGITEDVVVDERVVVEGEHHHRNDPNNDIQRKLGLYTQDNDRNVTGEFTLTVPEMVVKSSNFTIEKGTVIGDIYVEANGFVLNAKVDGNVTFASEEYRDSATIDEADVTGEVTVAE